MTTRSEKAQNQKWWTPDVLYHVTS